METFFAALEQAIEERNWYAALTLSLTLPDICAQAEKPGARATGRDYQAWVKRHLTPIYTNRVGGSPEPVVFLSAGDCYALRCALLHGGSAEIDTQRAREVLSRFTFFTPGRRGFNWHRNQVGDTLILMVDDFARDVLSVARSWWRSLSDEQRQAAETPLITLIDSDSVKAI